MLGCYAVTGSVPAQTKAGVDFANAYIFRGVTVNDSYVMQPCLDVTAYGKLNMGVWGNYSFDDYGGSDNANQFSELDLYGSYTVPVGPGSLSFNYTEYTYPTSGSDADRELGIGSGITAAGISWSGSIYYGIDGSIDGATYIEFGASRAFDLTDKLMLNAGATLAYLNQIGGPDGFSNFTAGLQLSYAWLSAGITYIGQIDDDVLTDSRDGSGYDINTLVTVGVSHSF